MKQLTNTLNLRVKATMLLLFLGIWNISNSQSYFSKVLPGWENNHFVELDTSYVSIGKNTVDATSKNFLQVCKISKKGDSSYYWDLKASPSSHSQIKRNGNYVVHNNQIVIPGDINLKGCVYFLNQSTTDTIKIVKTNITSRFHNILHENGKWYILGDAQETSTFRVLTSLFIFDSNFNLLKKTDFDVPFQNIHLYPNDITSTSDGGFLLLCQEEEPDLQIIGANIKIFRSTLIKTDSLGNEEWRKHIGDTRFNNMGTNIIKARDDSTYFLCWQEEDSIIFNWYPWKGQWETYPNPVMPMKLSRIKENGDEIWTKTYETVFEKYVATRAFPMICRTMIKTKDNHIVIGGVAYNSCLMKVTEDGELVWHRYDIEVEDTLAYNNSTTLLHTILETSNGEYIIGGKYEVNITPYTRHAYIIKLDKYGCPYPDCHKEDKWYTDSVENEQNKSNKGGNILLYPNPTNSLLTIKLPSSLELTNFVEVFIYTAQGKLMETSTLTDYTTQFSTSNLPKGMYIFQFKGSGIEEENYKVVVY